MQHCTHARHGKVGLEMFLAVPHESRHTIAGPNSETGQGRSQLPYPLGHFGEGGGRYPLPVEAHHLTSPVHGVTVPEQMSDRERAILHGARDLPHSKSLPQFQDLLPASLGTMGLRGNTGGAGKIEERDAARGRPASQPALGLLAAAGPVLLALAACVLCLLGGWRGTDWAAQVYRSGQASHWTLAIWDPGWYGGTYPLNYSLVYPLLAGYLGLWPVAALSSAGAAFCFDRLALRHLGRRPVGSWYFAITTFVEVAIGQLPTLTGEAFALGSVLCLTRYRDARYRDTRYPNGLRPGTGNWPAWAQLVSGLGLGALAGLASPVVGAFLTLALAAWALADVGRAATRQILVEMSGAVVALVSTVALVADFSRPWLFSFCFWRPRGGLDDLRGTGLPCLASTSRVRAGAVLYAAASVGLFVLRTPVGDNDTRFAAYIGVPLVVCYLPRLAARTPLSRRGRLTSWGAMTVPAAVVASLVAWNWAPAVESFDGATNGPSSRAVYYEPLIAEIEMLSKGKPVRVEIPPTAHHWESAYVAQMFPLARGWERQLDIAYDALFYQPGPLGPSQYLAWLVSNGVSYVALADAPLDYAATAEASLLRSRKLKGLQAVWHTASWQLWAVEGSRGLASAPATVVSLNPHLVEVHFSDPGESTLKLRWSPYWSLPPASARTACLSRPLAGGPS